MPLVCQLRSPCPPSGCRGGSELTYKYVVRNAVTLAPVRWQEGNDATLQVPKAGKGSVYRVREAWDASFREVEVGGCSAAAEGVAVDVVLCLLGDSARSS